MDRLDSYLEQVCRSIGGPRAMREHVRQELREHLLDAVSQHQAAGLPDQDAITLALAEFGKPEELRSELEATHGRRMLASVIDSAMQWKEKTMRAKWLWTTWAYLGLVAAVALEAFFITFMVFYIVPRYQRLMSDGMLDASIIQAQGVAWMPRFLNNLMTVTGDYTTFIVFGAAALWGLFEWRVRSENKTFMRLSALGTAAVALAIVVMLTAGSMLVTFTLAMPALGRMVRPYALEQVATLDASVAALEAAAAKQDWKTAEDNADKASTALHHLAHGTTLAAFVSSVESPNFEDLRLQVGAAQERLGAARSALVAKNSGRLQTSLAEFRHSFAPVRDATRRSTRQ